MDKRIKEIAEFKDNLDKLFAKIIDQAIENDVYFNAIIDSGKINLPDLKTRVENAQNNAEMRDKVSQWFAQTRQAIFDAGILIEYADLLKNLPTPEKSN